MGYMVDDRTDTGQFINDEYLACFPLAAWGAPLAIHVAWAMGLLDGNLAAVE